MWPFVLRTALLCACACLAPAATARDEVPPPLVSWTEISRLPGQYLGQRVRLQIQFHSPLATWDPFMTRFGQREFTAVRAWADEQFPWVATDFETPAARLFMRRGSEPERVLASARRSARYEVVAVVREVFLGRPWVEAFAARPLVEEIGEGTLIHARRAIELSEAGAWKLSEAEYERAITPTLPAHARAELERLRELVRSAPDRR